MTPSSRKAFSATSKQNSRIARFLLAVDTSSRALMVSSKERKAEMIARCETVFVKYDEDKDGVISPQEVGSMLRSILGGASNPATDECFVESEISKSIERMMTALDRNNDGKLSVDEFTSWLIVGLQRNVGERDVFAARSQSNVFLLKVLDGLWNEAFRLPKDEFADALQKTKVSLDEKSKILVSKSSEVRQSLLVDDSPDDDATLADADEFAMDEILDSGAGSSFTAQIITAEPINVEVLQPNLVNLFREYSGKDNVLTETSLKHLCIDTYNQAARNPEYAVTASEINEFMDNNCVAIMMKALDGRGEMQIQEEEFVEWISSGLGRSPEKRKRFAKNSPANRHLERFLTLVHARVKW